jgi:hypothetical protein
MKQNIYTSINELHAAVSFEQFIVIHLIRKFFLVKYEGPKQNPLKKPTTSHSNPVWIFATY